MPKQLVRFSGAGLLALAMAAGLAGCGESREIVSYTIPKEPPRPNIDLNKIGGEPVMPASANTATSEAVDPATGPDRMLGAVIVRPTQMWFFKITGAEAAVAAAREPFIAFLKTVEFDGDQAEPRWKLPEGWSAGPERQMRFATLEFESEGAKLELAISSLGFPGGDVDGFLLMNLNRWLGQMSLPDSTLVALRSNAELLQTIELPGGVQATVVNFRGKQKSGGMGPAPFAR